MDLLFQPLQIPLKQLLVRLHKFLHAALEFCILGQFVLFYVLLIHIVAKVVFLLFFFLDVGGIADGAAVIVGMVQFVIVKNQISPESVDFMQ